MFKCKDVLLTEVFIEQSVDDWIGAAGEKDEDLRDCVEVDKRRDVMIARDVAFAACSVIFGCLRLLQ